MQLKVKKLHPDAILPKYQTAGAACFDLHALDVRARPLFPDGTIVYRTGLSFEVPPGMVMMIYSRSGHGFKNDVRLSNCVGVIDSDYRGEVMVKLICDKSAHIDYSSSKVPDPDESYMMINPGDRIAQAMIIPVQQVQLVEVDELGTTDRGVGGMGSTGV